MRNKILATVTAAVLLSAGAADAAIKQANFTVSATVAANCLVSATNLAFGNYLADADVDGSSTVSVRCTNGTSYTVALSTGAGNYVTRTMANGGDNLAYNLFTDNARSIVWGDATGGTQMNAGVGTGLSALKAVAYTVYGRVPNTVANQDAPVGNYTDTITATVTY